MCICIIYYIIQMHISGSISYIFHNEELFIPRLMQEVNKITFFRMHQICLINMQDLSKYPKFLYIYINCSLISIINTSNLPSVHPATYLFKVCYILDIATQTEHY